MVQKYIIDKADIHNLLTGKDIPLEQGSKARAFCVEVAGEMTNGEVIQAVFNVMVLTVKGGKVWVEKIYFPFDEDWWNAPYKAESEVKDGRT